VLRSSRLLFFKRPATWLRGIAGRGLCRAGERLISRIVVGDYFIALARVDYLLPEDITLKCYLKLGSSYVCIASYLFKTLILLFSSSTTLDF
jgi:hypothetical protein